MKVHYLQHVHFEGLGYMEIWLKENNHSISATRFYEAGYSLPSVAEIDALIVMGGSMGVYDEDQFSWLREEKMFIENCIQAGKKVLGICLGAQLIADCLGAKVAKAEHKEIGWFPVIPTEESKKLTWFYDLFKSQPIVFHWHGDKFQIPGNETLNLLSSEANNNQAFYFNQNVIGLQFHLEVTEETTKLMLENGGNELTNRSFIQSIAEIKSGIRYVQPCNKIMSDILNMWLSPKP